MIKGLIYEMAFWSMCLLAPALCIILWSCATLCIREWFRTGK